MFFAYNPRKIKKAFIALLMLALIAVVAGLYVNIRYPLRYMGIIHENASQYGLDPALILAIIQAESKFDSLAISRKGASGLMQVTEPTADWLADEMKLEKYNYDRIFEPEINIQIGCYYLNKLLRRYTDQDVALAAYNAGSGNVNKWLSDSRYSDDGRTLKEIPFKETRDYISRIRRNKQLYDILLRISGTVSPFIIQ